MDSPGSRVLQPKEESGLRESDWLQLKPPDPQNTNAASWPTPPPPNEVYNLDGIGVLRKGVAPQPAREEPAIQPGAWDPADILRDYQIFSSRRNTYIRRVLDQKNTLFLHLPIATDHKPRRNPPELPSAWQVPR